MEEEIKVGNVVCFESAPTIKLTVIEIDPDKNLMLIHYNHLTNVFDTLSEINPKAVVLYKE